MSNKMTKTSLKCSKMYSAEMGLACAICEQTVWINLTAKKLHKKLVPLRYFSIRSFNQLIDKSFILQCILNTVLPT